MSTESESMGVQVEEKVDEHLGFEEKEPLMKMAECRICQEDDDVENLESPCGCNGSLKFAHRLCVQRWCCEKKDTICEICHKPFEPGYTAPKATQEDTSIDIAAQWMEYGSPVNTRLLALQAAERRARENHFDETAGTNSSGVKFCRFTALIVLAILLWSHSSDPPTSSTHAIASAGNGKGDDDEDFTNIFYNLLIRAFEFLLPCYIMAWAVSIIQGKKRREGPVIHA